MSYWECTQEAPKVYAFVGETPEQVMRECADFLEEARGRGEYLTQWNVSMGPDFGPDDTEQWFGTLTTSGAGYVAPWPKESDLNDALADWERELLADAELPGMWELADFTGGQDDDA